MDVMRMYLSVVGLVLFASSVARAHHPEPKRVHPRIDVIGPLGNCLPPSYRRTHNRPKYLAGKLAYKLAPTSQEAIAWHQAEHRGDYCHDCPTTLHYFYPKPWEALRIGPRDPVAQRELTEDDTTEASADEPNVTFDFAKPMNIKLNDSGSIRELLKLNTP